MEILNNCPYCEAVERTQLQEQHHKDKYLCLIDERLTSTIRYWFRCAGCDLIYHSPRTTRDEEKILYERFRDYDFRKISASEYFKKLTSLSDADSECYKRIRWLMAEYPGRSFPTILDVGCGGGILLNYAKRFFPDSRIVGVEPNKEYGGVAERELGIEVIPEIYRKGLIDCKFSLILCTDVIEHIADIDIFWEVVVENLSSDGVLFIEIPSVRNFDVAPIDHDFFESQHLYFFTKKLLSKIANRHRFRLANFTQFEVDRGDKVYKDLFCFVQI